MLGGVYQQGLKLKEEKILTLESRLKESENLNSQLRQNLHDVKARCEGLEDWVQEDRVQRNERYSRYAVVWVACVEIFQCNKYSLSTKFLWHEYCQ